MQEFSSENVTENGDQHISMGIVGLSLSLNKNLALCSFELKKIIVVRNNCGISENVYWNCGKHSNYSIITTSSSCHWSDIYFTRCHDYYGIEFHSSCYNLCFLCIPVWGWRDDCASIHPGTVHCWSEEL